jgi:hypothetical protein
VLGGVTVSIRKDEDMGKSKQQKHRRKSSERARSPKKRIAALTGVVAALVTSGYLQVHGVISGTFGHGGHYHVTVGAAS